MLLFTLILIDLQGKDEGKSWDRGVGLEEVCYVLDTANHARVAANRRGKKGPEQNSKTK